MPKICGDEAFASEMSGSVSRPIGHADNMHL